MSWQASGWAKKCRTPSPTHKLALLVAADYATDKAGAIGLVVPDGSAVCWASIEEIALDCDVSPRTIGRIFADLERDGLIRRDRRYVRNPRVGQAGQPAMVRTTDAIWIDYARPYVIVPPDEKKIAAKARAGRAGGKVSAERRAARVAGQQRMAAAAASLDPAGPGPAEPDPGSLTRHPAAPLGDILLAPQATPSVRAEPSGNLQITDRDHVGGATTDRARGAPQQPDVDPEVGRPNAAPAATAGPRRSPAQIRAAALARSRADRRPGTPETIGIRQGDPAIFGQQQGVRVTHQRVGRQPEVVHASPGHQQDRDV
jgi:hypothetical protein